MVATSQQGYQGAPYEPDEKIHRRKIAESLNYILKGKINCHLDVTLNASTTSTIIKDSRIGIYSVIAPAMPLTSDGANAVKNGIYVNGLMSGQATVNHASNSATDQTIRFLIIG